MKLKQLSLFLENKPGALGRPIRILAREKVNIVTLSIAEANQFGILRLIVQDWERVKALLESEGLMVKITDVVAVEVADRPGGLAEILEALEVARINVEFMYAFTEKRENRGVLIFRFDDPDKAIWHLQQSGINVVGSMEWLQQTEG